MSLQKALLAELKQESGNTRKMLALVPTDKLDWRPHEKSMSIGRLAAHIAETQVWFERIILADSFDFAESPMRPESGETTEEILQHFDALNDKAIHTLENTSSEALDSIWSLRNGEHVYFQLPKKIALRNFTYNHIYHHRGQLSVYLRLLNIPVPGMYGPSADEK